MTIVASRYQRSSLDPVVGRLFRGTTQLLAAVITAQSITTSTTKGISKAGNPSTKTRNCSHGVVQFLCRMMIDLMCLLGRAQVCLTTPLHLKIVGQENFNSDFLL
jgi:hypothetical protein